MTTPTCVDLLKDPGGLSIYDYHCGGKAPSRPIEEHSGGHEIVAVRRGYFVRHDCRGTSLADSRHALFFNASDVYSVEHPVGCQDQCTVIRVAPSLLAEIAHQIGVRKLSAERPFAAAAVSFGPTLQLQLAAVRQSSSSGPLGAAEAALGIVTKAWHAAITGEVSRNRRTRELASRQIRIARRAHNALVERLRMPTKLGEIAKHLAVSPFHLARLYRQQMGCTLHQALIRLRLSEALDDVVSTGRPIGHIALEFSFADHAHFSRLFRAHYGVTPSALRQRGKKRNL